MDERTLDRIFAGSLNDMPPVLSRIVRIFTSSTFTDMSLERNTLMEEVYPKLKEYCKQRHGLEFQVVDMRWGVRDEATDDHMTTQLCMNELRNCQRLSVGPNFVTFLGQKYGYRPIPTYIEASEFHKLCDALVELQITEVELLSLWYREDTNAVPATFILQPISSILKHFNNKKEPDLMGKDQSKWWATLAELQKILRIAACHLFDKGLLTPDEKHNYIMAVTEREVINGLLSVSNTKDHCIAYIRQIQKVNMTNLKEVNKFLDLLNGEVDTEAADLLSDLRDKRVFEKIVPSNIVKYKINWSDEGGLNANDHFDYLQEFTNHFYKYIVKLVRRAMRKEDQSAFGKIVTEILQHSHTCGNVSRLFLGREDELQTIKEYITGSGEDKFKYPLILHGVGGSGKTSLLAKAASLVSRWCRKPKAMLVLRFLGTTPDSSSVIPTLTSMCQQLTYNYTMPMDQMPDDLIPLTFYYKQLLLHATYEQPLFIFLDSVNQLDGPNEVDVKLSWLTYELPEHVKLVISCVSDGECPEYHLFRKAFHGHEYNFLQVKTLSEELSLDVVKLMLNANNRTLTGPQQRTVQTALSHCTLPIFIKLVAAEVLTWKSYSINTWLSINIMDSIMHLFNKVELQHGRILVGYALAYITASKNGVSESELEDLISLDDIVLNDVYQYHLPPARRIPPLLWTRIRSDLPNYLTERDADGVSVMNWYHRQFREASIQRYLTDSDQRRYFHSEIADYFIGKWGGGTEKPFKYTEVQRSRFAMKSDEGRADRKVPLQPNVYYGSDGNVIRFNGRKFGELPYHLARAGRFKDVYDMCLFNYAWLHSKLSCCPLQAVLNDFEDCKEVARSHEQVDNDALRQVQLLIDALKLAAAILIQYPSMLAPQVLARLLPLKDDCPHIDSLLKECDELGPAHCALVPINHCLHTPGGPLMYSLEGHPFAVFDFVLTSDQRYILSVSNKFLMWDLSTGEVSRDVDPMLKGIMQEIVITADDKQAIAYTTYNEIYSLDILTGEVLCIPANQVNVSSPIISIDVGEDNETVAIWTREEWVIFALYPKLEVSERYHAHNSLEVSDAIIITLFYNDPDKFHIVYKVEHQQGYYLQSFLNGERLKSFKFHDAIVTVEDICFAAQDDKNIYQLDRIDDHWVQGTCLPLGDTEEGDKLLSLSVTPKEDFLLGVRLRGFQIYDFKDRYNYLALPGGVRNIAINPLQSVSRLVFTRFNQYAIAGIRRNLYVWSVADGSLLKTIDAHYGRIKECFSLMAGTFNAVVTSSLDRTVKVWNVKNIFEPVYAIDRMELPVDSISFSSTRDVAISVTRSSVGVWNLKDAKLQTTLSDAQIGAIVTHAVVTENGHYLLSIESGKLLVWDLDTSSVLRRQEQPNVKFMALAAKSSLAILVSFQDEQPSEVYKAYKLTCITVPDITLIYEIEFTIRKKDPLRGPQTTVDNQYLVVPVVSQDEEGVDRDFLFVYYLTTGDLMRKIRTDATPFTQLSSCSFRGKEGVLALTGSAIGFVLDVNSERIVTKVSRWNGACTSDGKLGLFASPRGALEILELRHGSTVKLLIPKVSEGIVNFITGFTSTDDYVYYYHNGKKTIRLFRVDDGEMIANYRLSAEARVIRSSPDGTSLVIGGTDGSFIMLIIADPTRPTTVNRLRSLPSRAPINIKATKKDPLTAWKSAARLATVTAGRRENEARGENVSNSCILS
ncbi:NACHT and WD repeat domain-containing protein 2 [Halotydeus destructor]|nr:NACHT and WD repeat domain-containing protein 2 [Halotydeus destructor]